MTDNNDKPGHLARRFQQISVAVFHAAVEEAGYDLTPVQYAALTEIATQPGIDQATLAGLIAFDRTTITGVVDRLVQKGLLVRQPAAVTAAPMRWRSPTRDVRPSRASSRRSRRHSGSSWAACPHQRPRP